MKYVNKTRWAGSNVYGNADKKRRQQDDNKNYVLLKLLTAVLNLKITSNYFGQMYVHSISQIFYNNLNFWWFLPIGPIVQRSAAVPS